MSFENASVQSAIETESVITKSDIDDTLDQWNRTDVELWKELKIGNVDNVPVEGEKNILITSALPYVNNVPHLGNIVGSVLSADVFARYCRLRGYNVLYICGTDEYGTATENKALEEKLTPREICDKYHKIHSDIYTWFNIEFDKFGRTTTDHQTKISQDIFWKIYNNGYVIKNEVEQLFCQTCERFLADRFVEGICPFCAYEDARGDQCDKCGKLINATELKSPRCKTCSNTPHIKSSCHLFIDLPKIQPKLEKWILETLEKENNWSQTAKVITHSWIRDGLKPRCITRDLKWGTPVPLANFEDKVFYVWFDAPIGYISITAGLIEQWEKWWKNPEHVELYNFLGKDNVAFHAIIFPSTELCTGEKWTMVSHIPAVEYLNYEDTKFSKSRGIGVFGDQAKETGIPSDIWRFYLLYMRPENQDTTFSWSDLMNKNNSELLNNLGNFVNRSLSFLIKNFDGILSPLELNETDHHLLVQLNRELKSYINYMDQVKLKDGLKPILAFSRLGNQYMQNEKPWVLVKNEDTKKRAATVIGLAANISAFLSILLQPYMPDTCEQLQKQLNIKCNQLPENGKMVCLLQPGHQLGECQPLFQKFDSKDIEQFRKRFSGKANVQQECHIDVESLKLKSESEIVQIIAEQGDKVRSLKSAKAEKPLIEKEVKILLALKKFQAEKSK
ncbi:Methionine--tRNA ligase, cytoplasmic [Blomia tropicalis]|nr:Methionine--tRNA ligase, cytoplasmic [Blomia tropicalis]